MDRKNYNSYTGFVLLSKNIPRRSYALTCSVEDVEFFRLQGEYIVVLKAESLKSMDTTYVLHLVNY